MLSSRKPWPRAQVQPWPISTKYSALSRNRPQAKRGNWESCESFMPTGQSSSRIGLELARLLLPVQNRSSSWLDQNSGSINSIPDPRSAANRAQFATCLDLLVENLKVAIGHLPAQERT